MYFNLSRFLALHGGEGVRLAQTVHGIAVLHSGCELFEVGHMALCCIGELACGTISTVSQMPERWIVPTAI